ncbi:MAG: FGGY-family carbohydrate kinase [Candidatus Ornithospirochaeta sp.]|nr:FGGY-family carbohydrate kinase [Candidatus Ornithospirochaeta sp.]
MVDSAIGIEFGSTRVKACMIGRDHRIVAEGSYGWENRLENGVWTYSYDEIAVALQRCFASLKKDYRERYGETLSTCSALGISAMMHGMIASDDAFSPILPFRTWRNTITGRAAAELTDLFSFNIPQRWSIAHLYQTYLEDRETASRIKHVETLASYVHRLLSGVNGIGLDDASGMFPIDPETLDYDAGMASKLRDLTGLDVFSLFPSVYKAGTGCGLLTEAGALLLDPDGDFRPGVPMVPPEGDAGTGMAATCSVRIGTGNISAGTSDFAMVVTDKKLSVHREIDVVTTPMGVPVAMVHCNNCTTDINSWINLFGEFASLIGADIDKSELYSTLYSASLSGSPDVKGLMSCGYYSGEGVTDFDSGIPVFLHRPDAPVHLGDFMRLHLMSSLATLKIGMDILRDEGVGFAQINGHGGFFKTPEAGQRIMSAAIGAPVSVMETAGEGGAYGMALLAAYSSWGNGMSLEDYLEKKVFAGSESRTVMAGDDEVRGFDDFIGEYRKMLLIERKALEVFNA